MVKRIDFLGAPGVGKSTLYNKIIEKDIKLFVSEKKALFRSGMSFTKTLPTAVSFLARAGLTTPLLQQIILSKILAKTSNLILERSVKNNESFYNIVDNIYSNSNNPVGHRKFQGYLGFLEKMKIWQFIESYFSDEKIVLSDESISQKIYGIYGIRQQAQEDLKYAHDYFSTIPLPKGLIYMFSDIQSVVENIKQRDTDTGYLIPGHRNINLEELMKRVECTLTIAEIGRKVLGERGVPLLEISSTNSIDRNLAKTEQFLKAI